MLSLFPFHNGHSLPIFHCCAFLFTAQHNKKDDDDVDDDDDAAAVAVAAL